MRWSNLGKREYTHGDINTREGKRKEVGGNIIYQQLHSKIQ